MEIYKQIKFEAAHNLNRLPGSHPCTHLHGHSYLVEVWINDWDDAWRHTDTEMVCDYGDLSKIVRKYDHQNLNDFFEQPTAEVITHQIVIDITRHLKKLGLTVFDVRCRVHETDTSWAEDEYSTD